jgi:hypothetical protein
MRPPIAAKLRVREQTLDASANSCTTEPTNRRKTTKQADELSRVRLAPLTQMEARLRVTATRGQKHALHNIAKRNPTKIELGRARICNDKMRIEAQPLDEGAARSKTQIKTEIRRLDTSLKRPTRIRARCCTNR